MSTDRNNFHQYTMMCPIRENACLLTESYLRHSKFDLRLLLPVFFISRTFDLISFSFILRPCSHSHLCFPPRLSSGFFRRRLTAESCLVDNKSRLNRFDREQGSNRQSSRRFFCAKGRKRGRGRETRERGRRRPFSLSLFFIRFFSLKSFLRCPGNGMSRRGGAENTRRRAVTITLG